MKDSVCRCLSGIIHFTTGKLSCPLAACSRCDLRVVGRTGRHGRQEVMSPSQPHLAPSVNSSSRNITISEKLNYSLLLLEIINSGGKQIMISFKFNLPFYIHVRFIFDQTGKVYTWVVIANNKDVIIQWISMHWSVLRITSVKSSIVYQCHCLYVITSSRKLQLSLDLNRQWILLLDTISTCSSGFMTKMSSN